VALRGDGQAVPRTGANRHKEEVVRITRIRTRIRAFVAVDWVNMDGVIRVELLIRGVAVEKDDQARELGVGIDVAVADRAIAQLPILVLAPRQDLSYSLRNGVNKTINLEK
jgi:hypothetical protein